MSRPTPRGRHNLFVTNSGVYAQLHYQDPDQKIINLSNYSASMYIRNNINSSNYILKLTHKLNDDGTGINMSNSLSGSLDIQITPLSSSMIPTGRTYYSLDVYSGSYYIGLLEGKIIKV